ncbi:MAG: hypothetical protein JNJ57_07940, partial [Saprospiraceae bacterium]|nr:hypothetical protein [Saprospiraceae bacterium]
MTKRTLLLAVLFLALGGGAWYALSKKDPKNSHISWDMDFAIRNPEDIGKVFIADRKGQSATLERKDGRWIYNGQYP